MNRLSLTSLATLTGLFLSPATVTAQSMIEDTTPRKQALTTWGVQFEEFEYRYSDADEELVVWNGDLFYGTDELKARWLTTGEYAINEQAYETLENQFVAQTPISRFFDARAGIRIDTPEGQDRTYAVLGIAGLAPQWFEIDGSLYISDEGDASAEVDAEYELLLTNYWILSATLDGTIAFSDDREIGVGTGLVSTETGLRASYDLIDRTISPYVGVVHERQYGNTADLTEAGGGDPENWFAVIGMRMVF
ncbi:copper resistance protein B [Tamilnaduibacter salinus]|uniref:Copper resistance protein B n=2 Tax=Tamilnaduibacter salinus TaxID=1484056 RepID=A0A2U1CZC8_9GAMM|nr:copper resistance protein B [Tamilnaduibacter salinus]PVY78142.1 copper resistance protein B [Tamilnaduibacter salinus]